MARQNVGEVRVLLFPSGNLICCQGKLNCHVLICFLSHKCSQQAHTHSQHTHSQQAHSQPPHSQHTHSQHTHSQHTDSQHTDSQHTASKLTHSQKAQTQLRQLYLSGWMHSSEFVTSFLHLFGNWNRLILWKMIEIVPCFGGWGLPLTTFSTPLVSITYQIIIAWLTPPKIEVRSDSS